VKLNTNKEVKQPFIVVCGYYGTGKSTVSNFLQRHLDNFSKFNFEEVRSEMGIAHSRENVPKVMRGMDLLVRKAVDGGFGIIVDRPHQTYGSRTISYDAAREGKRQVLIIECVCPEEITKARIVRRSPPHNNNPESYDRVKSNWEEITLDYQFNTSLNDFVSYIRYDTHRSLPLQVQVTNALREFTERVSKLLENFKPQ